MLRTALLVAIATLCGLPARAEKKPIKKTQEDIVHGCVAVRDIEFTRGTIWAIAENNCAEAMMVGITAVFLNKDNEQTAMRFVADVIVPHAKRRFMILENEDWWPSKYGRVFEVREASWATNSAMWIQKGWIQQH